MNARVEALIRDAKEERKLTAKVIRGIYEVNRHKDYLEYNCDSLFQFCVLVLGYEGGVAWRRIEAAKLLEKAPDVAEKIESGALTLSNVATISRVQAKARQSDVEIPVEKLIEVATHTETRVAERRCLALAMEYGVDVDPEKRRFENEVEDLLSALSHKHPGINKEALLRLAVHEMHEKYCASKTADSGAEVKKPEARHRPAKLDEAVKQKGAGCCGWKDEHTGKICGSRHQLEIDHIVPLARGGKTEFQNLRVLCRFHNQLAAREAGLRRPLTSARKLEQTRPPAEAPHTLVSSA